MSNGYETIISVWGQCLNLPFTTKYMSLTCLLHIFIIKLTSDDLSKENNWIILFCYYTVNTCTVLFWTTDASKIQVVLQKFYYRGNLIYAQQICTKPFRVYSLLDVWYHMGHHTVYFYAYWMSEKLCKIIQGILCIHNAVLIISHHRSKESSSFILDNFGIVWRKVGNSTALTTCISATNGNSKPSTALIVSINS